MSHQSIVVGIALVIVNLTFGFVANVFGPPVVVIPGTSKPMPEVGAVLDGEEVDADAARAEQRFKDLVKNHPPLQWRDLFALERYFYVVALTYLWALVRFRKQRLQILYVVVTPALMLFVFSVLPWSYVTFFAIAPLLIAHAMRSEVS